MSTAALMIQIRADASQAMSAIKGLETNLKSFSSLGSAALPASLALTGAGAAITAGLGGAVKTAADFDAQMVNIRNNTNMSAQDQQTLSKAVVQMGNNSGAAFDQLAQGGKKAMNITGNMASSLAILDVAQKSAVSTGANVAQVTNVLANAMHEYNADVGSSAQVHQNAAVYMGVMHQAAAMSNMDLQEFADNSGRAIGIAANLGIPLEQVAAAYVALTKHGYNAADAQTQIVNAMTHMINPSAQARAELEKLSKASGVDLVSDFSAESLATKGLDGVMADITQAYVRLGLTQAQATGETMKLVHAQRGGLGLATALGTGAEDYAKALTSVSDKEKMAALTDESMARTRETLNNKMAVFSNRVETLGMAVGSVLLPPLTVVIGALGVVAGWFAQLPTPIVTVIGYVGVLAGIALTAAGTLGLLGLAIPKLIVGFQALGAIMGFARTAAMAAASGTAGAWLTAAAPVLLVIGAIVTAGAGLYLAWQNNFLGIRDIIGSVVNFVADKIAGLMDWLAADNLLGVGQNWREGWQKIKDDAGSGVHGVGDAIKSALDGLGGAVIPDVDKFIHDVEKKVASGTAAIGDTAGVEAAKAAKKAADAALKDVQDATTTRKLNFEMDHVKAERDVLTTKLDQTVAESQLVDYKRQIEDLDRNAIDYARKRLELDEQDAVTKAKIAESALKAKDEDLSYEQKLIKARLIASRHGGPAMDRASARAQLKDLHKQQLQNEPGLLIAEHNTTLANRAKEKTDLQGSLVKTELDRRKLAIEEQMAPYEKQAVLAKRTAEDAQRALDLEKQRFQITESYYEKDRIRAELKAKDAEHRLYVAENPRPTSALITVNVGGITVVNNGDPGDTARLHQTVVDAVTQAARDAKQSGKAAVSPRLGGAGYGLT